MRATIDAEALARASDDVHDASRAFHFAVAAATGNQAFTKLLDGLWIADIGRRLLAQRRRTDDWQDRDIEEHRAIVAALEAGDGREHVRPTPDPRRAAPCAGAAASSSRESCSTTTWLAWTGSFFLTMTWAMRPARGKERG